MTAKEAKNQKIFVLNYDNADYRDASNLENKITVEETNYYDFVSISTDETTTPRGVAPRTFIEERDIVIKMSKAKYVNDIGTFNGELLEGYVKGNTWRFEHFLKWLSDDELNSNFIKFSNDEALNFGYEVEDDYHNFTYYSGTIYEIMNWGATGNKLRSDEQYFLTVEEAEDFLFQETEHRFYNDDQRSTDYFNTLEEANDFIIETLSDWWGTSKETTKSIIRRQSVIEDIKNERLRLEYLKQKEEANRIESVAKIYANMIEKVENEAFDDTVKRLASAIGERIEKKVFYKAVKLIRGK